MIDDMTDAIAMLSTGTADNPTGVTVKPGPSFVESEPGRFTPVPQTPWVSPWASVQPLQGASLKLLPAGAHSEDWRDVWLKPDMPGRTLKPANSETQRGGDVLVLDGIDFQVMTARDWRAAGGYFHALVCKQQL